MEKKNINQNQESKKQRNNTNVKSVNNTLQSSNKVQSYEQYHNKDGILISINFKKQDTPESLNFYNNKDSNSQRKQQKSTQQTPNFKNKSNSNNNIQPIRMTKERLERFVKRCKIGKKSTQKSQKLILQASGCDKKLKLQSSSLIDEFGRLEQTQIELKLASESRNLKLVSKSPEPKLIYDEINDEYYEYNPTDFYKSGFEKNKIQKQQKEFQDSSEYYLYLCDDLTDDIIDYNMKYFGGGQTSSQTEKNYKEGDWIIIKTFQDQTQQYQQYNCIYVGQNIVLGENHQGIIKKNIKDFKTNDIQIKKRGKQIYADRAFAFFYQEFEQQSQNELKNDQQNISWISQEFCKQVFEESTRPGYNSFYNNNKTKQTIKQSSTINLQELSKQDELEKKEQQKKRQQIQRQYQESLKQIEMQQFEEYEKHFEELEKKHQQQSQNFNKQDLETFQQKEYGEKQFAQQEVICNVADIQNFQWREIASEIGQETIKKIVEPVMGNIPWMDALTKLKKEPNLITKFLGNFQSIILGKFGIKSVVSAGLNIISTILNVDIDDLLSKFTNQAVNSVKKVTKTLVNGAEQLTTTIIDGTKKVVKTVCNGVTKIVKTIVGGANKVVETVCNGVKTVVEVLNNGVSKVVNTVVEGAKTVGNFIGNGIRTVNEVIKKIPIVGSVSNFIGGIFGKIGSFFGF